MLSNRSFDTRPGDRSTEMRHRERAGPIFVGAEVMMDDTVAFLKGPTLYRLPQLGVSSPATPPAVINHHPKSKEKFACLSLCLQPLTATLGFS